MTTLDRSQVAKAVRAFLENRQPPASVRERLDFGFRFHNQRVELFEIRRNIFSKGKKIEHAFAKATFVKSQGHWKVYWMRGNLKWHPYEPAIVNSLEAFLKLVAEDKHGAFFG